MWAQVEQSRKQMHEKIDQKFNDFILNIACGDLTEYLEEGIRCLMTLWNRVAGNFLWLLSDKPKNLHTPLNINEGLYFEGKFDTEALLRNLTKKLLEPVGYNYSGIATLLRIHRAVL